MALSQTKPDNAPVTVISKAHGWLTVDPLTLSRKNAIEKDQKINIRQSSKLAPPWMITAHSPDVRRQKMFKPTPVIGHLSNLEPKRVIMGEVD